MSPIRGPLASTRQATLLCLLAIGLLASTACADIREAVRQAALTPAPPIEVGQTLARGNWQYTVTKVERVGEFRWTNFGNVERAKGIWIITSLTLRNLGDRNFGIDPSDFELRDVSNVRYDPCVLFACQSLLTLNGLSTISALDQYPPGVDVRTALSFDVNPSASGLQLILKQANNAAVNLDAAMPAAVPSSGATATPPALAAASQRVPAPAATSVPPAASTPLAQASGPWNLLRDITGGGNTADAATFAAALTTIQVSVSPPPTLLIKFYVQFATAGPTIYMVVPRQALAAGVAYSPYGRWSSYDVSTRQSYMLEVMRRSIQHYPNTTVNLYAYRDDGAPLGEGHNNGNAITVGAVLPAF